MIDSGHPDHAPFAVLLKGEHFTEGDMQGRLYHRDVAAQYGNPDVLLSIAELCLAERAVPKARQLLQQAAAAGSTVAVHSTQMFDQNAARSASELSSRAKLARAIEAGARRLRTKSPWEYVKDVLGSIGSFNVSLGVTGVSATLGATEGRADSGSLDIDLKELVEDISTAMGKTRSGFGIFIDEMQDRTTNSWAH